MSKKGTHRKLLLHAAFGVWVMGEHPGSAGDRDRWFLQPHLGAELPRARIHQMLPRRGVPEIDSAIPDTY